MARLASFMCSDALAGSLGSPLGRCGDVSVLILVIAYYFVLYISYKLRYKTPMVFVV